METASNQLVPIAGVLFTCIAFFLLGFWLSRIFPTRIPLLPIVLIGAAGLLGGIMSADLVNIFGFAVNIKFAAPAISFGIMAGLLNRQMKTETQSPTA